MNCFQPISIFLLTVIILASLSKMVNAGSILFFMGMGSPSHRVALQPLAVKLTERGHNVTFLSYQRSAIQHENITEFFPEASRKLMASQVDYLSSDVIRRRSKQKYYDPLSSPQFLWDLMIPGWENATSDPEFHQWLNNSHFDLIIYDSLLNEVAYGIAYKMRAKVIAFVTTATQWMYDFEMYGLPVESSWLPDFSPGSDYPIVPHHFVNAYNALWWYFSYKWYYLPKIDEMLKKLFGEELPPVEDLVRRNALVFVNEHFSSTFQRSLPPFVVPIGGMHCQESKGILQKEVEAFLTTKERFVFISFGSAIKFSALPKETHEILFKTVASISDTNFLWKWDGEIPKNRPKNVLTQNWFPQQDILAHPKCKGFISQGGVMSYQQAVFHGVPLIVMPVWGDQNYVAYSAVYHGNGIHLELTDINNQTLTKALRDLLDDGKYFGNAREMSRRFKDRPMSSLDTGVWWTEYALRHDTAHLKSPGIQKYWWQRRLLDFWTTILIIISLCAFTTIQISFFIGKKVIGLCGNSDAVKSKQS